MKIDFGSRGKDIMLGFVIRIQKGKYGCQAVFFADLRECFDRG
jgi:hypothetical protein